MCKTSGFLERCFENIKLFLYGVWKTKFPLNLSHSSKIHFSEGCRVSVNLLYLVLLLDWQIFF